MRHAHFILLVLMILFTTLVYADGHKEFSTIIISIGEEANDIEKRVAELLKERLSEKSQLKIRIEQEASSSNSSDLLILLGRPDHHAGTHVPT